MKRTFLLILTIALFCSVSIKAATINVTPSDYVAALDAAADGDILLMEAGTYSQAITFPTGKTITLKAAQGAEATITFGVSGTVAATGGGLIFDGVIIQPAGDYFVSGDMGDITILAFRNTKINKVNRCVLRTNTAGFSINEIEFTNCIISNCGDKGWNFLYPKHAVKKVTVNNCTLYNYTGGESFFFANQAVAENVLNFTFENNTVYKWAKSSDRALCNTQTKYSASSTFTFRNNIVSVPGVDGTMPKMLSATGGSLISENNLIVNYGAYEAHLNPVSQTIADLTLEGLGLTSISFPDPANGDFTILSSSKLATAGKSGTPLGDPRWIKTLSNVVNLATSASPAEAGVVVPVSAAFESGATAKVTATANYGFRFKEWQDETGKVLSTENPYSFTITKNISVKAVFSSVNMYSLAVNLAGEGAAWGKVSLSPSVAKNKYEEGTIVDVKVVPNGVTSFLYWDDNTNQPLRQVQMDANRSVTATFDVIPFITGWDFNDLNIRSNLPGNYSMTTDNTGFMNLYEGNGTVTNWGGSTKTFNGITYNCARRYTDASVITTAPRYFEAKFSGKGYSSIQIKSKVGIDNTMVHKMQKMQYSTDGTNFTDLVTFDVSGKVNSEWVEVNASLPEMNEEQKNQVFIRWAPDKSSELLGAASGTEGYYLAEVYVYAEKVALNDTTPPVLISSVPAAGSKTASANGSIVLTFDEKIKAGAGTIEFNGKTVAPVFGSKTVTIAYSGLSYSTSYSISIPAGALTDMSGNDFAGTTIQFTTMNRPDPIKKLYDAVIAKDGSGDYTNIQAAVDAAPANRTSPWLIFIKNGRYEELVRIPSSKPYLYFIGQDKEKVIITFSINCSSSPADSGWEFTKGNFGQSDCATVVVASSNFYAENISFENNYGVKYQNGPQALAIKTSNDRFAFYNCKMRSFQDTWQTTTSGINDRHYAYNCWIEGAVDYVYGAGDVFIDQSTLYNVRSGSVIVAPSHKTGTKYGYVFNSCVIDGNKAANDNSLKLGRPWHDSPIAVYLNSIMKIKPAAEGWTNMGVIPKLFAEYNSMDENGNPIDLSGRKTTYTQSAGEGGKTVSGLQAVLSTEEAAKYTYENVVSGSDQWNPRAYFEPVAKPANLSVSKNLLNWDDTQYAICYAILRDSVVIGFSTESSYTDTTSVAGTTYTYQVQAANEYGSLSEPSNTASGGIGMLLSDVAKEKPVVYVKNSVLHARNIPVGACLGLYSINGSLLFRDTAESNIYTKQVWGLKGVYILKINKTSFKIVL
jgi:pectin methylesterase-like acyl-CoA thioesterase